MASTEVRSMSDSAIVEMLVSLKPSDQAVAWLASLITDEAAFEGVRELRLRFTGQAGSHVPATPSGRIASSRTVFIDPHRWASFAFRRRLSMTDLGPLCGRCEGWGSVMKARGRAGFYALDDLACALGIHVSELIQEVGTDEELQRLSA